MSKHPIVNNDINSIINALNAGAKHIDCADVLMRINRIKRHIETIETELDKCRTQ